MSAYSERFYTTRDQRTRYAANVILSRVLTLLPPITSAIDVGCGVGTWLSVLQSKGIEDIRGVDGPWVNPDLLVIPAGCFQCADLATEKLPTTRRYDLAMSLEVAEHLPRSRGPDFVSQLTAVSDFVLFAAAIPFQGGTRHVNEQWQHYWADLFAGCGYRVYDVIRATIWDDSEIPFWYRQNTLLFARSDLDDQRLKSEARGSSTCMPLDTVHPHLYENRMRTLTSVRGSFLMLLRAMKLSLKRAVEKAR